MHTQVLRRAIGTQRAHCYNGQTDGPSNRRGSFSCRKINGCIKLPPPPGGEDIIKLLGKKERGRRGKEKRKGRREREEGRRGREERRRKRGREEGRKGMEWKEKGRQG